MRLRAYFYLLMILLGLSSLVCPRKMDKVMGNKIQFDVSHIDENGLRNGEVAVDYEFCIPANELMLQEVMAIDPGIRVMKNSKGRIGCTSQQWLCINNTHAIDWKNKLWDIAYLDYVDRILETFYE